MKPVKWDSAQTFPDNEGPRWHGLALRKNGCQYSAVKTRSSWAVTFEVIERREVLLGVGEGDEFTVD